MLASETGVLTVAPEHIQRKGRLAPGKLFLLDLEDGRIVEDEEVKRRVARREEDSLYILYRFGGGIVGTKTQSAAEPVGSDDAADADQ